MFPFLSPCKPTISQRSGVETLQRKQKGKHRRFSVWALLLTPPLHSPSQSLLAPIPTSDQIAAGIALDALVGQKEAWEPGKGDKKGTCRLRAFPPTATFWISERPAWGLLPLPSSTRACHPAAQPGVPGASAHSCQIPLDEN